MRKLFLTYLLLCFSTVLLHAQNWEAFAASKTYHYQSDTATFPDQSIHFDSLVPFGNDTILSVARRFRTGADTSLRNQAMFCGREIVVLDDIEGNYFFRFPIDVRLPSRANYTFAFTIDNTNGTAASITRKYAAPVFGSPPDSIKVFTTTLGDSLVLSKAHGILEWPASLGGARYVLVGIQEDGLGDTLPGFDGFFQFKAGDTYDYASTFFQGDVVSQEDRYKMRMDVDSVVRSGAGMTVHYSGLYRHSMYLGGTLVSDTYNPTSGSFLLSDNKKSPHRNSHEEEEKAPLFLRSYAMPLPWATFVRSPAADSTSTDWQGLWTSTTYVMGNNGVELHGGRDASNTAWLYGTIGGDTMLPSNTESLRFVMREGLGITLVEWSAFEWIGTFELSGAIIDGDTIGTLHTDSIFTSRPAIQSPSHFSFHPNPGRDQVALQWAGRQSGDVSILDSQGRVVMQRQGVAPASTIDISQLPAGIYLLRLSKGGSSTARRLIKQ